MRYRPAVLAVLAVLALLLAAGPILAGPIPAKSEMAVSGSFVNPANSASVWSVEGQIAMPIGAKGYVLLGPKLRLGSDDATQAAGAVLEVNFAGSNKSGFYVGANGFYNLKEVPGPGIERYSADAVAGLKVQLGSSGCSGGCGGFKVFGSKTVAGRGKDDSDVTGNVGLFVRF